MDGQHGHVGRRDAADAQGLAEAAGGELHQLLAGLVPQANHRSVVDGDGDELLLHLGEPLDLAVLAGEVSFVLSPDLDLTPHVAGNRAGGGKAGDEIAPGHVGAAQEVEGASVANEQENVAKQAENRAQVVLAEAEVPKAIADALRSGNLGIMDFYRMRNVQADTAMRDAIAQPGDGTKA